MSTVIVWCQPQCCMINTRANLCVSDVARAQGSRPALLGRERGVYVEQTFCRRPSPSPAVLSCYKRAMQQGRSLPSALPGGAWKSLPDQTSRHRGIPPAPPLLRRTVGRLMGVSLTAGCKARTAHYRQEVARGERKGLKYVGIQR